MKSGIAIVLALVCCCSVVSAQQPESLFDFSVPFEYELSNDLIPGVTGEANREVVVTDGHFVFADTQERMRVFGVNMYYSAAFPDSADAILTARRLASLGFNCVRFLGIDYSNWNASSVLQNASEGGSNRLSEDRMKRFDWFVYQLKQHGIYTHIPLHSRRQARAQDNVTLWDSIPYQSRIVVYYDQDLRRAYKEFVSLLLNHRNQYTGNAYKDEPALAFIDILDDQSLFQMWRIYGLQAGDYTNFSHYHASQLDTLWHDWLRAKYEHQEALEQAWAGATNEDEIQTLANGSFENAYSANWQLSVNQAARAIAHPTECEVSEGELAYHIRIDNVANPPVLTHIQLRNQSFTVERGATYRLEFDSKSEFGTREIRVDLYNSIAPYNQYGLYNQRVFTSDEWTHHSLEFRATATDEFGGILRLFFGDSDADLFLDNFTVTKLAETGLDENELLDDITVRRIAYDELSSVPIQRAADMVEFYMSLVEDFYLDIKSYVKDDLQCSKPLGAAGIYDGVMDVALAAHLDFTSPYTSWDYVRNSGEDDTWAIAANGMLSSTYAGNLPNLTKAKIDGKPAIASRLYMPFPNPFMNELSTVWPAYLQYQDFDGMYLWYYATNSSELLSSEVPPRDFYALRNNTALLATLPLASHAFRNGSFETYQEHIALQQREQDIVYPPFQAGTYWLQSSADNRINLFRGVSWINFEADVQSAYPQNDVYEITGGEGLDLSNMKTDTEQILWNAEEQFFTGYTGSYLVVQGLLNGQLLDFDDILVGQNNNAMPVAVQWYSLDNETELAQAESSLLTVSTRSHLSGSTWEPQGSLWRYEQWDGHVQLESAEIEFILESDAESLLVFPVNQFGIRQQNPIQATKFGNRFRFVIDQTETPNVWYHVVQQFSTSSREEPQALPVAEAAVFPLPASTHLTVAGSCAQHISSVRVCLVDAAGRTVQKQDLSTQNGQFQTRMNVNTVPAGAYTMTIACGETILHKKIIVKR